MSLFSRKRPAQENTGPDAKKAPSNGTAPGITHRLTLDLSRAHTLAAMMANSRSAQFIEISDLLAGLYIYEWDRLAEYWPEENRDDVEDVLRGLCKISPQRWNSWIQSYDAKRRNGEGRRRWLDLAKESKKKDDAPAPVPSAGLQRVFSVAERIAPFHDKPDHGNVPILTSECILLCMAKYISSDVGKKLNETGLNIEQLERAVIDPKRSPRG